MSARAVVGWLVGLACIAGAGPSARAASCAIVATTGVAFGAYDVFDAAPVVAAGSVSYECTDVAPTDRIVIELALALDGTAIHRMTAGGHALLYQLFLDAARSLPWGTGDAGTSVYGPVLPANATVTPLPIFARIPARQDVPRGSYRDDIVVTLQL